MNLEEKKDKALNTWLPILEILEYKGAKMRDIAYYAEKTAWFDTQNFLPVSIKILTGLTMLDKIEFTCEDDDNILKSLNRDGLIDMVLNDINYTPINNLHKISVSITKCEIEESKMVKSIDMVSMMEEQLIRIAITNIDNEISELLNNGDVIFNTKLLAKSIDCEINGNNVDMTLTLSYNIKNK